MKLNKYLPVAVLYFFVNSLGLPFGLSYTSLLSPLFYLWIVNKRKKEILWPFLVVATPFVLVQLAYGVNQQTYIPALLNTACIYIFCQAFYTFLIHCKDIPGIFRTLVICNFVICLIGIPLYFTPYSDILWISQFLTPGIPEFRRFKMFAYEGSIYATQFTPLFFYFFMRSALGFSKTSVTVIGLLLVLPFLLSFSIGVMGMITLALLLESVFLFRYLSRKKSFWLLGLSVILIFVIGVGSIFLLFPENALFHRLGNIVGGKDNSGRGRTFEAFYLSQTILELKNVLFGIGPGQLRIIGTDIVKIFYNYPEEYGVVTIPNTTAETLMVYGYLGLAIRIGTEIFLCYRTKVWTNYYRFALFIFIFIYQFTGSFLTNIAEYIIWILAFTNCFPEFDVVAQSVEHDPKIAHEQIGHPESV